MGDRNGAQKARWNDSGQQVRRDLAQSCQDELCPVTQCPQGLSTKVGDVNPQLGEVNATASQDGTDNRVNDFGMNKVVNATNNVDAAQLAVVVKNGNLAEDGLGPVGNKRHWINVAQQCLDVGEESANRTGCARGKYVGLNPGE